MLRIADSHIIAGNAGSVLQWQIQEFIMGGSKLRSHCAKLFYMPLLLCVSLHNVINVENMTDADGWANYLSSTTTTEEKS